MRRISVFTYGRCRFVSVVVSHDVSHDVYASQESTSFPCDCFPTGTCECWSRSSTATTRTTASCARGAVTSSSRRTASPRSCSSSVAIRSRKTRRYLDDFKDCPWLVLWAVSVGGASGATRVMPSVPVSEGDCQQGWVCLFHMVCFSCDMLVHPFLTSSRTLSAG